jgi:hypothetical protein
MAKYIYHYSAELCFDGSKADGVISWDSKILSIDDYRRAKSMIAKNMFQIEDGTRIHLNSFSFLGEAKEVGI